MMKKFKPTNAERTIINLLIFDRAFRIRGFEFVCVNNLKNFYIENDEKVLGYDYQPIFSFRIRGFEFVCVKFS